MNTHEAGAIKFIPLEVPFVLLRYTMNCTVYAMLKNPVINITYFGTSNYLHIIVVLILNPRPLRISLKLMMNSINPTTADAII